MLLEQRDKQQRRITDPAGVSIATHKIEIFKLGPKQDQKSVGGVSWA